MGAGHYPANRLTLIFVACKIHLPAPSRQITAPSKVKREETCSRTHSHSQRHTRHSQAESRNWLRRRWGELSFGHPGVSLYTLEDLPGLENQPTEFLK